jgi:hypothetical protein
MAHSTETDSITPERRSEIGPDNAAVRALLARLARAVTSGDGEAAAATWATPALVLGDDIALTVSSSTDIRDVYGSAKAQYNARGISDTRPDILRLDWITHRLAIVEVRWPYLAADGDEIGEETSTYVIRREPDGSLAIRAAIMHGEAATH